MRNKLFLLASFLVSGGLIFLWYVIFYMPIQFDMLNMKAETQHLRENEREILDLKARHGDLLLLLDEKERQLDSARKFLPSTIQQDKFIDEIYRAASLTNTEIISVQVGDIVTADKINSQLFIVKLDAEYISLMNFIREIVDGDRLVDLEKFNINSSDSKILSCELNFKIFSELAKESRSTTNH